MYPHSSRDSLNGLRRANALQQQLWKQSGGGLVPPDPEYSDLDGTRSTENKTDSGLASQLCQVVSEAETLQQAFEEVSRVAEQLNISSAKSLELLSSFEFRYDVQKLLKHFGHGQNENEEDEQFGLYFTCQRVYFEFVRSFASNGCMLAANLSSSAKLCWLLF